MIEQLRRHRLYILMFSLNLAVLIGVIYLLRRPEPRVLTISTPAPLLTPPEAQIQVQVSGAILQPGVYTLTLGARVSNALDAAGGARPDADLSRLDLASRLEDGGVIEVPTRAATAESKSPAPPPPRSVSTEVTPPIKIDINTATVDQLDTLPGIGSALAQRIVDYREQHGAFERIDDIKNVKGIGDGIFEDFKDLITVK